MAPIISTHVHAPSKDSATQSPESISPTKDYQDEEETRDSKFKTIWDNEMSTLKNKSVSYQDASVLLLSWAEGSNDLHTEGEVNALDRLFQQKFRYRTVQRTLSKDEKTNPQVQVNYYLAEFVRKHDGANTLLIIYYAGHGRPGEVPGSLRLTGSTSLRQNPDDALHEIVWDSAEHNIRHTTADVLVIFDCCHAGELERSVRGPYARRAFEFLAATSAKSTTKKPGPESFTSALIWSLDHLVGQPSSFSTQELVRTIQNDAPRFPDDQSPRLSEGRPATSRKIMLAPLEGDVRKKAVDRVDAEEEEDISDELRQDLLLRFVFDRGITDSMVKDTASHMRRLIHDGDIKAKTVSWEGITIPPSLQYSDTLITQIGIRHFRRTLHRIRKNRLGSSSIGVPSPTISRLPQPKIVESTCISVIDSGEVPPPCSPSVADSFVNTPDPNRLTAEPEIGEDNGSTLDKVMSLESRHRSVSPTIDTKIRRGKRHIIQAETPKNDKRGRENDHHPTTSHKRRR